MLKMKMVGICCGALASVSLLGCTTSTNQDPRPAAAQPQPAPATGSAVPITSPSAPRSNAMPPAQGEFPGITVAIQELQRGSNTLTLKFVVSNQSAKNFFSGYYFFESEAHSVDGVHLIDPVNKKKYFVVRDSDGAPLCSRQTQDIAAGAQSVLWAKFPAPPDDVQKMTVEIPHFPPLEDVPVSR